MDQASLAESLCKHVVDGEPLPADVQAAVDRAPVAGSVLASARRESQQADPNWSAIVQAVVNLVAILLPLFGGGNHAS